MNDNFIPLTVLSTRIDIGGQAKTVTLDAPQLKWTAGQHLPIQLHINGQDLRRSYSISAAPETKDGLRISVKRVQDGVVSNFINDTIKAGDVIQAAAPNGTFVLEPDKSKRRTHYFFGAGSGITPLYAMLNSVMTAEPDSFAHLAYGNKNEQSILLEDDLNAIWHAHPNRMSVHYVFSKPSWWSSAKYWRNGYIDHAAITALITENPPYAQDAQYYVCGPSRMNQTVKAALMALDVPASRIHVEHYGGADPLDTSIDGMAATAEISLDGRTQTIEIAKGQTLLEAAKVAGLKPPYSCQSGVCGSCKARLVNGKVHMRAHMALEDSDIDKGKILTCQSLPTTKEIVIRYD